MKMGRQKTHRRRSMRPDSNVTPFPSKPESVADRREREGRCPECGNERACYSCLTRGGWISEAEEEEHERPRRYEP